MERKAKMGISALMIEAIVFLAIGGSFVSVGIVTFAVSLTVDSSLIVLPIIFGSLGMLFLGLGIAFLSVELKKRRKCNRLLQDGYYLMTEVVEIDRNYSVSYGNTSRVGGGRHPYIIKCGYTDENGTLHIFSSRNIRKYPGNDLIGKQVRVYVNRNDYNNFKYYYVDIDEVLGDVIEH